MNFCKKENNMASQQLAINNSRDLFEFLKNKWDEETLKKQTILQDNETYNLEISNEGNKAEN